MSQRELARATEELGRLQVQGGGDWYGRFMAVEVLYKDRESWVQTLEAEVRRQIEVYGRIQSELGEERAMRRMTEQQYASYRRSVIEHHLRWALNWPNLGATSCWRPDSGRHLEVAFSQWNI